MPRARAAVIRRQPTSEVGKARRAPADTRRIADIVPNTVRSLLGLVEDRGHAPERLCKGLGFTGRDLHDRDLLLSYQQVRALILRARRLLEEPAMGLAAGMRQRPVSWGLTGLAMLTCETFGEAIAYGLGHQHEAGAMMQHLFAQQGPEASIELVPHVFDLEIEPYLIEEAFAGALNVQSLHAGAGHPTACGGTGLRAIGPAGNLHALFPLPGAFWRRPEPDDAGGKVAGRAVAGLRPHHLRTVAATTGDPDSAAAVAQ